MSARVALLVASPLQLLYDRVSAARVPFLAWLAFILLQVILWSNAPAWALGLAAIVGLGVTYLTKVWPLAMIGIYTVMEASIHVLPSIYDREASYEHLWPVRLGLALFVGCWMLVAYSIRLPRTSPPRHRDVAVPSIWLLLVLLLVAVVIDAYRYRNTGIPLFSSQIDVVRFQLGQESNMILGLLSQTWTLGLILALSRLLLAGRIRISNVLLVGIFLVGSLAGGSRNTLLIGLVPPLFVLVAIRGVGRSAIRGKMLPRWLFYLAVMAGGAAVVGMFYFAGQRVLNGQGIYESWIQGRTQGSPWLAAVYSADLSLSAPLETWSRLFQYVNAHGAPRNQLNVLGGAQFLIEAAGYQASMYDLTAYLSRPLYMNVATLVAAPFIDFGVWGAMVFLTIMGTFFGVVDALLQGATSIYGVLGRGYLIYVGVFGVYEFLPYLGPSWLPIAIGLLLLHGMNRWSWLQYSRPVARRPLEMVTGGAPRKVRNRRPVPSRARTRA